MEQHRDNISFEQKCNLIQEVCRKKQGRVTEICNKAGYKTPYYYSMLKKRDYDLLTKGEKILFDTAWEFVNNKNNK